MNSQCMRSLVMIFLAALLTSCGGGGGGGAVGGGGGGGGGTTTPIPPGTGDGVPPTVITTNPPPNAVNVDPRADIIVTFSEGMDYNSLTANSVLLTGPTGTVTLSTSSTGIAPLFFTINPQPIWLDPGQYTVRITTSVKDKAGTPLAAAHSWNFSVQDRSWGPAHLVEASAASAVNPRVAMNSQGKALAAWQQMDGTVWSVFASLVTTTSSSWSAAQLLESNAGDAMDPQVGMDDQGNAIVVWRQAVAPQSSDFDVFYSRLTASTGEWSAATMLNTLNTGSGSIGLPKIAMNATGTALVVWGEEDDTTLISSIHARRYEPATGWGPEEVIENGPGSAHYAAVAMDPAGDAAVVWEQHRSTAPTAVTDVLARVFSAATGTWDAVQTLGLDTTQETYPQVAMDLSGNAITVWAQAVGSATKLVSSYFRAGTGTWSAGTAMGADVRDPSSFAIAMGGNGKAVVVSRGTYVNSAPIYGRTFDLDAGWAVSATMLDDNTGMASSMPAVCMDSAGNALAVWNGTGASSTALFWDYYNVQTGKWNTLNELILATSTADTYGPKLSMTPGGTAIMLWSQPPGTEHVYSSVFTKW